MFFFLCFLSGESGHLQKRFVLPSPVPIRISLTFHWLELGHCSSLSQSQVKGVTLLVLLLDHPPLLRCPIRFPGGPRLYWRADTWSEPRFHSAKSRKQRQSAEFTLLPVWVYVPLTAVLVCSGCYNRTPQMRWLGNKYRTFVSPSARRWEVQEQVAGRFGVWRGPTSWFTPVSSHSGKDEGFLWSPFNEDTDLIHEGSTSMTSSNSKYLPKTPPLNTIVLGVRILTYELGEGLTKHLMHCILPMVPPHSCFSHM